MNALDKLGLAIANAGITWTPEMRTAYEQGIKELEAAVLAEREACAKLALTAQSERMQSIREAIAAAIRARNEK